MSRDDSNPGLPASLPDLTGGQAAPLHAYVIPFHEYVWHSSWWERIVMLVVPVFLFVLFLSTISMMRSEYCWCSDEAFYSRMHTYEIHVATRWYLLGCLVSAPMPLLADEEMKAYSFQKYGAATGPKETFGMAMYPQSLIQQIGLFETEVVLYAFVLAGLLGFWVLLAITNLLAFAIFRRRARRYAEYCLQDAPR